MAAALLSLTDCCQPCASCIVTVTITGGGGTGSGCPPVKSLAEARALTSVEAAACGSIDINGLMVGGDGFVGRFTWDAFNANPDDGATYLEASDAPILGRWVRET